MSRFVLQRHRDNYYVAASGSAEAYTRRLEEAQIFEARGDAERHQCENESIVPLENLLRVRR